MKMLLLLTALFTHLASANDALPPVRDGQIADGRTVLTDLVGRTLYVFDEDTGSESTCYEACARAWPPALVSPTTPVEAPVTITTRRDGTLQLSFEGHPLYYFVGDQAVGESNGDGLAGTWHVIVRQ